MPEDEHVTRTSEAKAAVAQLWQEHMKAPFPATLRRREAAGIDIAELDLYTAGCVSTWQHNDGTLDAEHHRILRECIADLDRVLPLLTREEERQYCQHLRRMAAFAADGDPQPAP